MSPTLADAIRTVSDLCPGRFTDKENDALDVVLAALRGSLDAAWAEAEAALPEGWFLVLSDDPRYSAEATREGYHDPAIGWVGVQTRDATGPTPAAALRALAATLRERAS